MQNARQSIIEHDDGGLETLYRGLKKGPSDEQPNNGLLQGRLFIRLVVRRHQVTEGQGRAISVGGNDGLGWRRSWQIGFGVPFWVFSEWEIGSGLWKSGKED